METGGYNLGNIQHVLKRMVQGVGQLITLNPVTSRRNTGARRLDDVGNIPAARITERRNLVDVDTEPNHCDPNLPERHCAFTAGAHGVRLRPRSEMKANWRERIVIDPAIHHGEPCIKGTRVPLSVIVGSVADGDTPEQIIDAWPQLTGDDIKAALKFAAEAVNNADFVPLSRTNGR